MKIIDLVAILGALAWIPPIFVYFRGVLTKPKIKIITAKTVSIGFTTYGPIFNLDLAFSVENKDLVVSGVNIKLTHEAGEEKIFDWQGINQQLMYEKSPDGSKRPYEKEPSVLAMKLNVKDIEERFIRFQETSFLDTKYEMHDQISKEITYLTDQSKYEPSEYINSEKMIDLYNYIGQKFSWKPGEYHVKITLESPEKFQIKGDSYKFSLSPLDIEELKKNIPLINEDYKDQLLPATNEEYQAITWKWRQPSLLVN